MTRQQLAHCVPLTHPRIALMIEALLQAQADILHYEYGSVELAFAPNQVKMNLKISLGQYKIDKNVCHD